MCAGKTLAPVRVEAGWTKESLLVRKGDEILMRYQLESVSVGFVTACTPL